MVDGNTTDLASLLFNVSYVFMYKPRHADAGAMAGISGSGGDLQARGNDSGVRFDPAPWPGPCRRERWGTEREGRRGGTKREGGKMPDVTIVLKEFLIYLFIGFYDIWCKILMARWMHWTLQDRAHHWKGRVRPSTACPVSGFTKQYNRRRCRLPAGLETRQHLWDPLSSDAWISMLNLATSNLPSFNPP